MRSSLAIVVTLNTIVFVAAVFWAAFSIGHMVSQMECAAAAEMNGRDDR